MTEFLLAQIEDDESGWHAVERRENGVDVPVTEFMGKPLAARMLAECKAKREVVRLARECERQGYDNAAAYLTDAINALAAVYADHSDYRTDEESPEELPPCEGWTCQSCGADNFIPDGCGPIPPPVAPDETP